MYTYKFAYPYYRETRISKIISQISSLVFFGLFTLATHTRVYYVSSNTGLDLDIQQNWLPLN